MFDAEKIFMMIVLIGFWLWIFLPDLLNLNGTRNSYAGIFIAFVPLWLSFMFFSQIFITHELPAKETENWTAFGGILPFYAFYVIFLMVPVVVSDAFGGPLPKFSYRSKWEKRAHKWAMRKYGKLERKKLKRDFSIDFVLITEYLDAIMHSPRKEVLWSVEEKPADRG
jgi:hypothetical protein